MDSQRTIKLLSSLNRKAIELDRFVDALPVAQDLPGLKRAVYVLRTEISDNLRTPDSMAMDRVERLRIMIGEISAFSTSMALRNDVRPAEGMATPLSAAQILESRCVSLNNNTLGLEIGLNRVAPEDIAKHIPGQKIAAFQFAFGDGRLVLQPQTDATLPGDEAVAASARELLIEEGFRLLGELQTSNCGPRLISAFSLLQGKIEAGNDVVQIGMRVRTADAALRASSDEFAASQFAILAAHLLNISHYLAQFPAWQRFAENAAGVALSDEDLTSLRSTSRALASYLRERPNLADAAVPEALETVSVWAADSAELDGKVILALARTLENLWSLVVRGVVAVRDELVKEGRKRVAAGIIALVVSACATFAPSMAQIPGAEWINATFDYVQALLP
ncbi:hypothetical protein GAO09_00410 [Rhizobiales bacterium RZME27]|uniref:Uncharacterized protein n=1 Tax=Endobacterium cereale TaxID=2663029 RepID=A0A6A8A427_9HYPH|nr:hypothetical protein [Endobacterium cereale]MQY44537.1 hypothetical protein [Endobacterium cereale]